MKHGQHILFGGAILIMLALVATGCTTKSQARLQAQNAYLAGQNAALRQQQQLQPSTNSVTIVGPVQNAQVPWVAGLTLAQAIATANYLDANEPKQIVITRDGESTTLDANVLFNGTVVPVEAGDVIELRQ
jgi:hypothetical protein